MRWTFLIAAVLVPLVCFLLFKFQDGDFTLMIYEKIGQDPAVALRGKVVWITGASSGIGEYLAYELVKDGCKLVLSARRKAELERVKKNCAAIAITDDSSFKDQDILVLPLDSLKFNTHEKLTQDVLKYFGKVDILVNNAGRSQLSLVEKTSLEVDRALLDLNVVGFISLTKAVLPHMIERHDGQIVVVSSIAGKVRGFFKKNLSLGGNLNTVSGQNITFHHLSPSEVPELHGYFDSARLELAEHNIHIQTVLPGPVKSNSTLKFFTENINDKPKDLPDLSAFKWMSTERCAKLMAVGMANNLDEVWISGEPYLPMVYFRQYLPNLFRWFSKMFFMENIKRIVTNKNSSAETN